MDIGLDEWFDEGTLRRGQDYARQGLVQSIEVLGDGALRARVSNGRGDSYQQRITVTRGLIDGLCSCPVGYNCKHVAAVLIARARGNGQHPSLAAPVQSWLARVRDSARIEPESEIRPEGYPDRIKDRLLYVLSAQDARLKIDLFKGRINAAGSALNKSIRRYDAVHALRSAEPAKFIRPVDLELLSDLAQARLWDASYGYGYGLPDILRPRTGGNVTLIRCLCDTGRFLHENTPEAQLTWSEDCPDPRLGWHISKDGRQRLGFEDPAGTPVMLQAADKATFWIDTHAGQIGTTGRPVDEQILQLVASGPVVGTNEAAELAAALPETLGGIALPRPQSLRSTRRVAHARHVRLTLGAETAHDGPRYYGTSVHLPTLSLRFVYDGHDVAADDPEPRIVRDGEVVTLARDHDWEETVESRLMMAGALPVEDLEAHWPGERMLNCDFVFADGEMNRETLEISELRAVLDFAFRLVPSLRSEGWEIIETPKWPYRLSDERASLSVTTQPEAGEAFLNNDWFSLGFQADIGGVQTDVAPLIAAFLEQMRGDRGDIPEAGALARQLEERPIWLDRGKQGYVALDLSPLAPLLHLFLAHYAELGALHPSDAPVVSLVEDALQGSGIVFADNAGILPLARSLSALASTKRFEPPTGLRAELRDYQTYGVAWMDSLLTAGFGGVLADDMGLGKTVQTLALLQARHEAGAGGPALLVVPTSLIHSWQTQAAQFTPGLRLEVLHGARRAERRDAALEADLVITTYPLLTRDCSWLTAQEWPLVILDEAQTLKNPAAQMAKALRDIPAHGRLALTGTPLENSLQDLWTLTDWVNPGLLGNRKQFQAAFRTPIEKQGDNAVQARLNRRLRPFLLRRTKEQVAAELPPKTEILDRVDLPRSQQALYETVRSAMDVRVREAIRTRGLAAARITVLDALLKLRQVCCDPTLIKTDAAQSVTDSAKRARLGELVGELVAEGRRVLVFSQFTEMLRLIETDLAAAGIPCLSLTGQTRNRATVLDTFARGDAPVFLLSLKAGGVGLTLTAADTVILYDPWWNPAVERQAMDRTHRIGQDKPVFVHRLVAAGTVEEKILEMQARKQALADALFDQTDSADQPLLDEATLQDLFAPVKT